MGSDRSKHRLPGLGRRSASVAGCSSCGQSMSANTAFCPSCGARRVIGGPSDGADPSAPDDGRIILVNSGGEITTPGLLDRATEIVVVEPDGIPAITVYPERVGAAAPTAPARESTWRRLATDQRVLIGTGVAIVVMLMVAAAVVFWPKGDGFDVAGATAVGEDALDESADAMSGVQRVKDARDAAADAETAREAMSLQLGRVDEIDGQNLRRATRGVLSAQQIVLADWAGLSDIRGGRLNDWPDLHDQIDSDLDTLDDAYGALVEVGGDELAYDVSSSRDALHHLDDTFTEDIALMREWRSELAAATEEKDEQQALVFYYGGAFSGLMDRYAGLRQSLDGFTDRVDEGTVLIYEGYQELGEATASRQDVRNRIAALRPPDALSAAHSNMLNVLDEAIGACESAAEGLNVYLNDPYYFFVSETPGWQTFIQSSDRITESFDGARQTWEDAYRREMERVDAIELPERPVI